MPNRLVRGGAAQFGPTELHYRRLVPNYEKYWVPDSEAINSIDSTRRCCGFRAGVMNA
jgi:hypothetical protein